MQQSSRRIHKDEVGDINLSDHHCFVGIPTSHRLDYDYSGLKRIATEPAEYAYIEKILDFNLNNFLQKLETNPSSINEDLLTFKYLIAMDKY